MSDEFESNSNFNHSSITDISSENTSHISKKGRNNGKLMIYTINASDGQPCKRTYTALGSTGNSIQHLASIYGIIE
ncbi:6382_t:CDS:2 [Funneliformis geosporum]|nr:6382_t:CDS:2 [Funneliformis geosporum]